MKFFALCVLTIFALLAAQFTPGQCHGRRFGGYGGLGGYGGPGGYGGFGGPYGGYGGAPGGYGGANAQASAQASATSDGYGLYGK